MLYGSTDNGGSNIPERRGCQRITSACCGGEGRGRKGQTGKGRKGDGHKDRAVIRRNPKAEGEEERGRAGETEGGKTGASKQHLWSTLYADDPGSM